MKRLTTSVIWLLLALSFVNAKANDVPRQNEDDTMRYSNHAALDYCQERQPRVAHFNTIDPKADQYPGINPYLYCAGNPMMYVDPNGNEPVKNQVGTIEQFISFFNNTRTKMGQLTHQNAENALLRLSEYKIGFPIPKISPKTTPPFNKCQYRYVYTKKAGWIDMVHFLFYAGKAYKYKVKGDEFPAGKSLENGLFQEFIDLVMAPHSAFSYEDLVSDKFGAIFGAEYFDASSELSFGEQLCTFMKTVLEATSPDNAPNIKDLPDSDGCVSEPSFRLFNTTNPLFTTSILENE